MNELKHTVSVNVAGTELRNWETYDVTVSLTEPGTFSLTMPFDREAWDLTAPDRPVQVLIDGTPIITGFIDDSDEPESDNVLEVKGRDKVGRLVQESAPGINFGGLALKDLVAKLTDEPWLFPKVTLSNARNRNVIRGRGRRARASNDDLKVNTKQVGTKTEPGQSRFQVIDQLLEQSGYLVWSSGDGKELVLGQPNYTQEIQFRFFKPAPGSQRAREGNVNAMGIRRSTGDRYSRIMVVGSGHGTDSNYGASVTNRWGAVAHTGTDFMFPKRLVIVRSLSSADEAEELAAYEMSRRDAQGSMITVRVPGHGQILAAGAKPTIFACDTLVEVESERSGTKGVYTIASCNYRGTRAGAQETTLTLVKKNSVIGR